MHRMKEYYVSVRNHRYLQKPIIVFEHDDEEATYEHYMSLHWKWERETLKDPTYDDLEAREDEWWDDAPRLVWRTGDADYPTQVIECAINDL